MDFTWHSCPDSVGGELLNSSAKDFVNPSKISCFVLGLRTSVGSLDEIIGVGKRCLILGKIINFEGMIHIEVKFHEEDPSL